MKRVGSAIAILYAVVRPTLAFAQNSTNVDDCVKLEKSEARLACYDKRAGYEPKEAPKPEERPAVKWKVRDSGTVSPIGFAEVGTKPGLFQVGRTDGKDFTTAKVAVVGLVRAINQPDGFFDGMGAVCGRVLGPGYVRKNT